MKSITSKGVIETDVLAASVVVLLMVFLMMSSLGSTITKNSETKELFYLKSKAVFFADVLAKNSNQENPQKGIAFYNKQKRRVEENVIDLKLVEKINEKDFPELLKEIRIEFEEEKIIIGKKKGNCFEARRFILDEKTKEKGVLFVSACS